MEDKRNNIYTNKKASNPSKNCMGTKQSQRTPDQVSCETELSAKLVTWKGEKSERRWSWSGMNLCASGWSRQRQWAFKRTSRTSFSLFKTSSYCCMTKFGKCRRGCGSWKLSTQKPLPRVISKGSNGYTGYGDPVACPWVMVIGPQASPFLLWAMVNFSGFFSLLWGGYRSGKFTTRNPNWNRRVHSGPKITKHFGQVPKMEESSLHSPIWANYNDQTAEVTLNCGVVRESPPKSP